MSLMYLNQILPLLKEGMRLAVTNEDLGTITCKVHEVGKDWIGVIEEDEFGTYGELYSDDIEYNSVEIIG